MPPQATRSELLAEERAALARYRSGKSTAPMPMPRDLEGPRPTFVHGFFLPFGLIVRTLRDPFLRAPYLKLTLLRVLVVALLALAAWRWGGYSPLSHEKQRVGFLQAGEDGRRKKPVPPAAASAVAKARAYAASAGVPSAALPPEIAGQAGGDADEADAIDDLDAVVDAEAKKAHERAADARAAAPWYERAIATAREDWGIFVAILGFLSVIEAIVVFPSRSWDDWISFHASRHARILPESLVLPKPRLTLDFGYLKKKLKRRLRGYVVFLAGLPMLAPFKLIPHVGDVIFTLGTVVWAWYWFGVFAASKSAHAWADEANAVPPAPLLFLHEQTPPGKAWQPIRLYARVWTRLTSSIFPAVTTFERAPRAYLGLALARAILAFPLLYFFARPLVPVAAGRLCAESDPSGRFDCSY